MSKGRERRELRLEKMVKGQVVGAMGDGVGF